MIDVSFPYLSYGRYTFEDDLCILFFFSFFSHACKDSLLLLPLFFSSLSFFFFTVSLSFPPLIHFIHIYTTFCNDYT